MLSIKTSAVVITVQSSSSSLSSSSLPSSFLTSTTINNIVSSKDKLNHTRKQTQVNNYKSTHHNSCTNTPIHIIDSREQQTFAILTFLAKTRKHPKHRYVISSSGSPAARTSFLLPQKPLVLSSTDNRLSTCSSSRRKQLFGGPLVSCRCHY